MYTACAAEAAGGGAGNVTLSGETIQHITVSGPWAGVRINSDGTIDKRTGATPTYTQIDAVTDWIIPNGDASALYDVKIEEVSLTGGGSPTFSNPGGAGKGLSTWFDLGSNREWGVRTPGPSQSNVWTITIHIRWNGGAELDQGTYPLNVVDI